MKAYKIELANNTEAIIFGQCLVKEDYLCKRLSHILVIPKNLLELKDIIDLDYYGEEEIEIEGIERILEDAFMVYEFQGSPQVEGSEFDFSLGEHEWEEEIEY